MACESPANHKIHDQQVQLSEPAEYHNIYTVYAGGEYRPGLAVTKPNFFRSIIFLIFFTVVQPIVTYWTSLSYLTGVTAMTPIKYESETKNLKGIFVKKKISLTEKFNKWSKPIQVLCTWLRKVAKMYL